MAIVVSASSLSSQQRPIRFRYSTITSHQAKLLFSLQFSHLDLYPTHVIIYVNNDMVNSTLYSFRIPTYKFQQRINLIKNIFPNSFPLINHTTLQLSSSPVLTIKQKNKQITFFTNLSHFTQHHQSIFQKTSTSNFSYRFYHHTDNFMIVKVYSNPRLSNLFKFRPSIYPSLSEQALINSLFKSIRPLFTTTSPTIQITRSTQHRYVL